MANKKTAKKVATAKSAQSNKTVTAPAKSKKTVETTTTRVVSASTTEKEKGFKFKKLDSKLPANLINIVLAEVIGTFILTMVAVSAVSYFMLPFYVGLVLVIMVLSIGAISGAHINPAVTFGLWSMRKLKTALVPFYWIAQFLGAMSAVVLLGALSGNTFAINFDHFLDFSWSIFALELVGTAVFMFGVAAVLSREDLKTTGKAIGVGMALTIGIVVTTALFPYIQSNSVAKFQEGQAALANEETAQQEERTYPREVYIAGATLNPAAALAITEKTDSQLQGNPTTQKGETAYSRLSVEVIVSTLVGAALGGNLFLLVNYRARQS
ncbi:hypothetical protein EOM60_00350 [Candidatus Saccharibacteria bacterium]|nr:hypothetical protein [Candidatus Saccharibacteria bacterium]